MWFWLKTKSIKCNVCRLSLKLWYQGDGVLIWRIKTRLNDIVTVSLSQSAILLIQTMAPVSVVYFVFSFARWRQHPFLANVMSSPVGLSVVSVCRLSCSCTLLRRLKFSSIFLRHLVWWRSIDFQVKFYGDRRRGTSPSLELNTRGVAEYSNFGPIERYYISETVQVRC